MQVTQIKVSHHNRTIDGTFYKPEGNKMFPLVIFSHGYNGYKTDFDISARYFALNGIGAVCYTFCGGSVQDKSGFKTTDMTIFTEKQDLKAVIDEVQTWDYVDKNNLFLFGGSQGGLVSALAAEDRLQEIKGLILLYPALCIADNWNERYKNLEDIPDTEELWNMTLGRKFFETIHGFQVYEHIGKFLGRVFIIHGTEDRVVPFHYSVRAKEFYSHARLESFQGEGHGFSEEGNRRMEAMTMYFIHECIEKVNI